MIKLSPSILAADFANLERDLKEIENAGAHYVHIDVMDGMFVPNISFGIPVIKSIRKVTDMTFDVHLMIEKPERYFKNFADAGADIINFHVEATEDIKGCIDEIRNLGLKPAITFKPNTDITPYLEYLHLVDMVLVMSVEPGFGGQSLIPHTLSKVEKLSDYIHENNLNVEIEIDGGVTLENIDNVLNAGANVIVAGSSVFDGKATANNVELFYDKFKEKN